MSAKLKRPRIICDPIIPFSFAQSPKAPKPKYMCSECRKVFFDLFSEAQNHLLDRHPWHPEKKKRKSRRKSQGQLLPLKGITSGGHFIP